LESLISVQETGRAVNGRFSGTLRLSIYAKLVYEIRVYSARVMLCFYVAFSFLEF